MDFINGESANELIQAQAHVWNHAFNYIDSMSLKCAIQLGIFDIIHNHGKPMSLSELVTALPAVDSTKSHCIYHLMRVLVHSGFFALKEVNNTCGQEAYTLTPASRLLLKNEPFRASPLLLSVLHPILLTPWNFLSSWFQNNDAITAPFDMAHGMPFYDIMAQDPSLKNLFHDTTGADSQLITSLMLKECKGVLQGLKSLVDVGGGMGNVAKAISNSFPHLKACSAASA